MKMITGTLITWFCFLTCSAPPLSMVQQKENIEWVKTEIKRIDCEKQFALFIEHLGIRESGNRWQIINPIGCMGKFQFAQNTLKCLGYGYITPQQFAQNPEIFPEALQHQLLLVLFKSNEIALKDYMHYCGQVVQGIEITKSGLLAAAHLGGAQSVKLFLLTAGKVNKSDINKTSIKDYLSEFGGYNI